MWEEGAGVSGKGQGWERRCSAGREHENSQNPSTITGEESGKWGKQREMETRERTGRKE